ncbi:oligosaccharide flippase family protein [Limosilactobacillus fermentum]|uniref:oligosaccharide flippase family protein n=1 Tax=Limosilactobacillus fermentum TaxID=1613 RepID=UPI003B67C851
MKSKLFKNYLYNFSYQVLVLLTPLLTTPYISRTIGVSGVGIYSYCYSYVAYFSIAAALGISTYGQLETAAKCDDKNKISHIFYELIITKLITTVFFAALYILFLLMFTHDNREIYWILVINVIAVFLDISWFFQGLEEFKKIAIRNYIIKIASLILIFVFVKGPSDLPIYTLIIQGSTLIGNLTLWFGLKKYLVPIHFYKFNIWPHIRSSLIYFVPTLATTLFSYFDKTMIGLITHSEVQNGFYEQAYKIESISITVVSSLSTVIMPRATYLFRKKDNDAVQKLLEISSRVVLFLAVSITIGIISISDNFVPWFLGTSFIKSVPILNAFAVLILVDSLKDFYARQILIPSGEQIYYGKVTVLSVVLNIIGNYFLIDKFQAFGACISSIITELIALFMFMYKGQKQFNWLDMLKPFSKYILCGIGMGICVYAINWVGISNLTVRVLSQILVGIVAYGILLLVVKDDIVFMLVGKLRQRKN